MSTQTSQQLLSAMGVQAELLDSGCCGMAGSFGYESGHYEVSMKVGEHALLPRVRSAPAESLVIADGFSCREQIAQATDRRALHLSEVLAMALPASNDAKPKPPRFRWKPVVAAAVAFAATLLIRRR